MKFKHVFFIWLLADLFLAVGLFATMFTTLAKDENFKDAGFLVAVVFYGVLLSLPSLVVLLIFHAIYSKQQRTIDEYVKTYCIVILTINVLYFIVSNRGFSDSGTLFNYFYIFTTIAGLLALFLVQRNVRKQYVIAEERSENDLL